MSDAGAAVDLAVGTRDTAFLESPGADAGRSRTAALEGEATGCAVEIVLDVRMSYVITAPVEVIRAIKPSERMSALAIVALADAAVECRFLLFLGVDASFLPAAAVFAADAGTDGRAMTDSEMTRREGLPSSGCSIRRDVTCPVSVTVMRPDETASEGTTRDVMMCADAEEPEGAEIGCTVCRGPISDSWDAECMAIMGYGELGIVCKLCVG